MPATKNKPEPKAAADPARALSPAQVAQRFGVSVDHVLRLIDLKELIAIDLRLPGSSRPRWKVLPAALIEFERRRATQPAPAPRRRRPKPETTSELIQRY